MQKPQIQTVVVGSILFENRRTNKEHEGKPVIEESYEVVIGIESGNNPTLLTTSFERKVIFVSEFAYRVLESWSEPGNSRRGYNTGFTVVNLDKCPENIRFTLKALSVTANRLKNGEKEASEHVVHLRY